MFYAQAAQAELWAESQVRKRWRLLAWAWFNGARVTYVQDCAVIMGVGGHAGPVEKNYCGICHEPLPFNTFDVCDRHELPLGPDEDRRGGAHR